MATAITSFHGHTERTGTTGPGWFLQMKAFFADLGSDLLSTPRQMRGEIKTDLFRKHLNALAISYFALIVLLLGGSVPVLAYLIEY
jgi:hypothetical protein